MYLRMKYKNLTKEQITISLDRLTRFKVTRDKYIRVFTDILLTSLIEPKLRKSDIEVMDLFELTAIAEEIFNESLKSYCNVSVDKFDVCINNQLRDLENSVFINDSDTQKLLNNKILYRPAIDLIPDVCPINVKWLKNLIKLLSDSNEAMVDREVLLKQREKFALKYPLEKIVLVEGITEEILLPAFSEYLNFDFYRKGIQLIAAGGKNQVVKMYYKLINEVKLPIFILLDKDAEENIKQIMPKLRNIDKIHLVSCGEFEDLLPKTLIIKTVNKHFKNFLTVNEDDFSINIPTAKILEEIFKTRGLHEFKKAEFAKLVKENIKTESDISDEIRNIIGELFETHF